MNYDCIENLSEEEILKLYDDTIEGNFELKEALYFEVRCNNGISGYVNEVYPTRNSPRVGSRNTGYAEYGGNACHSSGFNMVVCRICGYGEPANLYGINGDIYSNQAEDCENAGGTMIVTDTERGSVCKIPSNE